MEHLAEWRHYSHNNYLPFEIDFIRSFYEGFFSEIKIAYYPTLQYMHQAMKKILEKCAHMHLPSLGIREHPHPPSFHHP